MSVFKISINPLMDFSTGTDAKKRRIIRDQKNPNPFRVGWYQTSRACMKKTIINKGDMNPIFEGISRLKSKVVTKANQKTNKIVSIEAMKRFLGMKLPEVFKNHDFEIIKEKEQKSVFINGVEIIVSPDVIYKITIDNQDYLGAVKFHISKTNVFDIEKSTRVAFIIEKYLEEISPKYEAKVISDLCFSIDVFGQRVISAPKLKNRVFNDVKLVCDEIKKIWSAA